jgi:hypothetical protein
MNPPPRKTIDGGWHLDIVRSQTMRGYLGAMDCSEIAIGEFDDDVVVVVVCLSLSLWL